MRIIEDDFLNNGGYGDVPQDRRPFRSVFHGQTAAGSDLLQMDRISKDGVQDEVVE